MKECRQSCVPFSSEVVETGSALFPAIKLQKREFESILKYDNF